MYTIAIQVVTWRRASAGLRIAQEPCGLHILERDRPAGAQLRQQAVELRHVRHSGCCCRGRRLREAAAWQRLMRHGGICGKRCDASAKCSIARHQYCDTNDQRSMIWPSRSHGQCPTLKRPPARDGFEVQVVLAIPMQRGAALDAMGLMSALLLGTGEATNSHLTDLRSILTNLDQSLSHGEAAGQLSIERELLLYVDTACQSLACHPVEERVHVR